MKRLTFALVIISSLLILSLSACDTAVAEDEDATIEGTVWSMVSQADSLNPGTSMTFPMDFLAMSPDPDVDGDGAAESIMANMYTYLKDGTAKSYFKVYTVDPGTAAGSTVWDAVFANMGGLATGLFHDDTADAVYTLSGNNLTMDLETYSFSISGNTATLTFSGPDVDDVDEDLDVTETNVSTVILKAVTSPSVADLTAAPAGSMF